MGFPKLLWLPDGREVTAHDEDEQARFMADGARLTVEPTAPVVALDEEPDEPTAKKGKK